MREKIIAIVLVCFCIGINSAAMNQEQQQTEKDDKSIIVLDDELSLTVENYFGYQSLYESTLACLDAYKKAAQENSLHNSNYLEKFKNMVNQLNFDEIRRLHSEAEVPDELKKLIKMDVSVVIDLDGHLDLTPTNNFGAVQSPHELVLAYFESYKNASSTSQKTYEDKLKKTVNQFDLSEIKKLYVDRTTPDELKIILRNIVEERKLDSHIERPQRGAHFIKEINVCGKVTKKIIRNLVWKNLFNIYSAEDLDLIKKSHPGALKEAIKQLVKNQFPNGPLSFKETVAFDNFFKNKDFLDDFVEDIFWPAVFNKSSQFDLINSFNANYPDTKEAWSHLEALEWFDETKNEIIAEIFRAIDLRLKFAVTVHDLACHVKKKCPNSIKQISNMQTYMQCFLRQLLGKYENKDRMEKFKAIRELLTEAGSFDPVFWLTIEIQLASNNDPFSKKSNPDEDCLMGDVTKNHHKKYDDHISQLKESKEPSKRKFCPCSVFLFKLIEPTKEFEKEAEKKVWQLIEEFYSPIPRDEEVLKSPIVDKFIHAAKVNDGQRFDWTTPDKAKFEAKSEKKEQKRLSQGQKRIRIEPSSGSSTHLSDPLSARKNAPSGSPRKLKKQVSLSHIPKNVEHLKKSNAGQATDRSSESDSTNSAKKLQDSSENSVLLKSTSSLDITGIKIKKNKPHSSPSNLNSKKKLEPSISSNTIEDVKNKRRKSSSDKNKQKKELKIEY